MQTDTLARAKIIRNARLGTLRLVIAFNVFEVNQTGRFKFPVQNKCDFVSGDLTMEEIPEVLNQAARKLGTNNIQLI